MFLELMTLDARNGHVVLAQKKKQSWTKQVQSNEKPHVSKLETKNNRQELKFESAIVNGDR